MIKRLAIVVLLVLAINFVGVVGGVGYLVGTGALDGEKLAAIRKVLFPEKPAPEPEKPEEDEIDPATTRPILRLDELLARQTGKPASEQVKAIRDAFDAQLAVLERQRRELSDLKRLLDAERNAVARDRAAVEAREAALTARETQAVDAEEEKQFQATLDVYNGMASKQVKDIFLGLEEETVVRFLQAMDPRRASRILKEFKTPEELSKAQSLLERMRSTDAAAETTASESANPTLP